MRRPAAPVTRARAEAKPLSNVGMEVAYQLPLGASPTFPQLFKQFDAHAEAIGIASYGISVTTMEEVFLKVGGAVGTRARHQATSTRHAALQVAHGDDVGEEANAVVRRMSRMFSASELQAAGVGAGPGPARSEAKIAEAHDEEGGDDDSEEKQASRSSSVGGPAKTPASAATPKDFEFTDEHDGPSPDPRTPGAFKALESEFDMSALPAVHPAVVFWRHFGALFTKRFHYARRDSKMVLFQVRARRVGPHAGS